jgi:hypothetical protein
VLASLLPSAVKSSAFSLFGTGCELASLRFDFLSLGDAIASVDKKKNKINSKE